MGESENIERFSVCESREIGEEKDEALRTGRKRERRRE